jgi:uncharacterized protein YjiK
MSSTFRLGEATVNLKGRPGGTNVAARFSAADRINTSAKEASDVTALPDGRLLVVGDTSDKIRLIDVRRRERIIDLPELRSGRSQLEGVAYDPVRHNLFVSREESREVLRYDWNPAKDKTPRFDKRIDLDGVGGPKNKGIEGLAYVPVEFSPTGEPQLLLAKEGKPRELMLIGDGGGGKTIPIKLEEQIKSVCKDFSAVGFDPKSGHLFLSSDESSVVAELKLVKDGDKVRAQLVQSIPLRDKGGKPLARVEGLTFNSKGDLYVLTENDGALHELKRK